MPKNKEVQLKDESQVKPEVQVFTNMKEIETALAGDPMLQEEFRTDEKGFFERHYKPPEDNGKNTETDSPTKPDEATGDSVQKKDAEVEPEAEDEDEEVTVKISKKLLGDYAKNRSPEEAIAELAKGKDKANKYIKYLTEEGIREKEEEIEKLMAENRGLQLKIKEFSEKPAKEAKQVDVPDVDIDGELQEIDLYSDDGQTKIKNIFKKMAGAANELKKSNSALVNQVQSLEKEMREAPKGDTANSAVYREFEEINRFARRHNDVFGLERDIEDIQEDFYEFSNNLAIAAGVKETRKPNGDWAEEMVKAFDAYSNKDSKEGEILRERLETSGVKLPEDYDGYAALMSIRSIKNSRKIPYDEAFAIFKDKYKDKFNLGEKKNDKHLKDRVEREARALQNREKAARETSAKDDSGNIDEYKMTIETAKELLDIPVKKRTAEQMDLLRKTFKRAGYSDSQTEYYLALNK
jgi:hypothetical protein